MYLSVLVNFWKPIEKNYNVLFEKCSPPAIVFFNISDLNFSLKSLLTIVNLKKKQRYNSIFKSPIFHTILRAMQFKRKSENIDCAKEIAQPNHYLLKFHFHVSN